MIDVSKLKRKTSEEFIGTRVNVETKTSLQDYCKSEGISISTLVTALIQEFLKSKGYLKTDKPRPKKSI